ncbi:MAG: GcrA family cell cycle regulator [Hyphomicrobiaceae bacterium]|nr:GcrA family cell cycle regulator [Hyphomicrobiaceae bacterium]
MTWNDERVDLLKKLWSDGLSASQIAGRLGGVTRNAVIGKVHRLGLSGRATTSRMKSHRPRTRPQPNPAGAKRLMKPRFAATVGNPALRNLYLGDSEPYTPAAEEVEIPLKERKYIQTLTESCCRWPIGDPQQSDFHFCGKKKVPGLPYCEAHARRAFQPPQPRRRDREVSIPALTAVSGAAHDAANDADAPGRTGQKIIV